MANYIKIINQPKHTHGISIPWNVHIGVCMRLGWYDQALDALHQALLWNIEQRFKDAK
jgi:hypothetical protein